MKPTQTAARERERERERDLQCDDDSVWTQWTFSNSFRKKDHPSFMIPPLQATPPSLAALSWLCCL